MLASPNSLLSAPARFLIGLFLGLSICFGVQAIFYYRLNGKAGKGESNYFSTLSRFQAAAEPAAEIAIAGSSITGRLPGREVGNAHVANLGSDGGPALDGITLLAENKIALPEWLVIETNTLFGGVGFGDSMIARSDQGLWFSLGVRLPLLSASARPSAMIYGQLLRRPRVTEGKPFAAEKSPIQMVTVVDVTAGELARIAAYDEAVRMLRQKGVKILLVQIPSRAMVERDWLLVQVCIAELHRKHDISFVNLDQQIPRSALTFTDGVHLSPESAAHVMTTIRAFCQLQK